MPKTKIKFITAVGLVIHHVKCILYLDSLLVAEISTQTTDHYVHLSKLQL